MIFLSTMTGATLTEREGLSLLAEFGLRTPRVTLAASAEQAVDAARAIGFPVVMKTASASSTECMIGLPITLKLVLRMTGIPVRDSNSLMRS